MVSHWSVSFLRLEIIFKGALGEISRTEMLIDQLKVRNTINV